jgi:hypothetical protein
LLTIIIFFLVVVCVTPLSFLNNIASMKDRLGDFIGKDNRMFTIMADQIAPFVLMLFNYQFIPIVVSKAGELKAF